jgi:hypothetical protein
MKRIRARLIAHLIAPAFLLLVTGQAAAQQKLLLDLKQLADKPRSEAEKILGQPSALSEDIFRNTRGTVYPALRATYLNGAVEVTYLENGARYLRIWVQRLSDKFRDYSYPKDAWTLLGDFGLDRNATPDHSDQGITRWRDFPGIYEINVFSTEEKKIWYAHVLTSRIYR